MKPLPHLILFDFDGVLSSSRFYASIAGAHCDLHRRLIAELFGPDGWPRVAAWMRGHLSYQQIHEQIAPDLGVEPGWLDTVLVESVKAMTVNAGLLRFAAAVQKQGVKTAVFTDNMDVFEQVLVPHARLDDHFDYVFSSSTFGALKLDEGEEFFQQALREAGVLNQPFLFLDDSPKIRELTEKLGGTFYHYADFQTGLYAFTDWFKEHYRYEGR